MGTELQMGYLTGFFNFNYLVTIIQYCGINNIYMIQHYPLETISCLRSQYELIQLYFNPTQVDVEIFQSTVTLPGWGK